MPARGREEADYKLVNLDLNNAGFKINLKEIDETHLFRFTNTLIVQLSKHLLIKHIFVSHSSDSDALT